MGLGSAEQPGQRQKLLEQSDEDGRRLRQVGTVRSHCGLEGKLSGCGDCLGVAGEDASPISRLESAAVSLGLREGNLG